MRPASAPSLPRWVAPRAGAVLLAVGFASPAPAQSAGDPVAGKASFAVCGTCHSLEEGRTLVGPSLHGLIGRISGTLPGFDYSAAMRAARIVWGRATLTTYLADPQKLVPGTKMLFAGIDDPKARRDLVTYLEQATR